MKDSTSNLYDSIKQAFLSTNKLLTKSIDCYFSGSTCVSVMVLGNNVNLLRIRLLLLIWEIRELF
jgi:hypothetical protein